MGNGGQGRACPAGWEECDLVLIFLSAHFHHIFEQLRFRQSSVGSIFLSAGESQRAGLGQSWVGCVRVPLIVTLEEELGTEGSSIGGAADHGLGV
jgi:hypothetical protein